MTDVFWLLFSLKLERQECWCVTVSTKRKPWKVKQVGHSNCNDHHLFVIKLLNQLNWITFVAWNRVEISLSNDYTEEWWLINDENLSLIMRFPFFDVVLASSCFNSWWKVLIAIQKKHWIPSEMEKKHLIYIYST